MDNQISKEILEDAAVKFTVHPKPIRVKAYRLTQQFTTDFDGVTFTLEPGDWMVESPVGGYLFPVCDADFRRTFKVVGT